MNKSYKEAILRAYPTEKENSQAQESLLSLKQQKATDHHTSASHEGDTPVIETHKNLMRSWMNLRGLDQNLAKSKRNTSKKPAK